MRTQKYLYHAVTLNLTYTVSTSHWRMCLQELDYKSMFLSKKRVKVSNMNIINEFNEYQTNV